MEKRTVLIIDEDVTTSSHLSRLLPALGYSDHLEFTHARGVAWFAEGNVPGLIVLNIMQSGLAGLKFLTYIREKNAAIPIVVVGSSTQIRLIIEAVQLGASEYLVTPFDTEQARVAFEHALEYYQRNEGKLAIPDLSFHGPFANPEMRRAYEIAKMVARTDVPVLITGESGVGKEVVARFIHTHSERASNPLIKVNCAALPNDLLESELFGYERGAFTGAMADKPGKFELANGGALLLDEIGEMPPQLQAKLLHVLHDGEYSRLGGKRQIHVDTRIIGCTNRKLEEAVSRGQFREDLYFRLNVIRIKVPPLRERKQEIPFLGNYFVKKYSQEYGRPIQELPREILQAFMENDWPGNVRQLENAVRRYLILGEIGSEITDFPGATRFRAPSASETAAPGTTAAAPAWKTGSTSFSALPAEFVSLKRIGELAADRAEREVVLWMLEKTNWNRKLAASHLKICYKALLNKIKRWQIRRSPLAQTTGSRRRMTIVASNPDPFALHAAHQGKEVS